MKTKISYSAAKLFINITKRWAYVAGTEGDMYPDEWALKCEHSPQLFTLIENGLVTRWMDGDRQYIPTSKGVKLFN